jgi:hypothetical protein
LLVLSAILGASFQSFAEEPELQKVWTFHGKESAVEVMLTRFVNKDGTKVTSLSIGSLDGEPRSVTEEAEFLAKVLDDLPKAGINAQSLDWISFRFNESEAVSKVAAYAASSKQWRGALKSRKNSVVYPLVTTFLNDSGAYKDWDRVFRSHDLTLRIAGVEKLILEPFPKSGAKCPPDVNCDHLSVPSDALVQMNVEPLIRR